MNIDKIISILLQDGFIVKTGNASKNKAYKLMDKSVSSVIYVSEACMKRLKDKSAIKKHEKGYWIISRRGIQQLHGKTKEKKIYKNERSNPGKAK